MPTVICVLLCLQCPCAGIHCWESMFLLLCVFYSFVYFIIFKFLFIHLLFYQMF